MIELINLALAYMLGWMTFSIVKYLIAQHQSKKNHEAELKAVESKAWQEGWDAAEKYWTN